MEEPLKLAVTSLIGRRHGKVSTYCRNPCRPVRGWGAAALRLMVFRVFHPCCCPAICLLRAALVLPSRLAACWHRHQHAKRGWECQPLGWVIWRRDTPPPHPPHPDQGPAGGRWALSWLYAMPQPLVEGMAGAPGRVLGAAPCFTCVWLGTVSCQDFGAVVGGQC